MCLCWSCNGQELSCQVRPVQSDRLYWSSDAGVATGRYKLLSNAHPGISNADACLELLGLTALSDAGLGWGWMLIGHAVLIPLGASAGLLPHTALCLARQPGACCLAECSKPSACSFEYHHLLQWPFAAGSCFSLSHLTTFIAHFPLSLPRGHSLPLCQWLAAQEGAEGCSSRCGFPILTFLFRTKAWQALKHKSEVSMFCCSLLFKVTDCSCSFSKSVKAHLKNVI